MNRNTRYIAAGVTAALACGIAGGVAAAQFGGSPPPDPEVLGRAIDAAPMTQVAEIEASADKPARGVFVQLTGTGYVCVWDAPSASSRQKQGGCNRDDDPLGGSAISASLAYDGGPSIPAVRDARLSGLASTEVASLDVLMNDGTRRGVKLKKSKLGSDEFQAFGFRFKKSDLKKGVGPTAVVAYDDDGIEIGRQPTGIGS